MSNRTTRNTHTEQTEAGEQLLANGIRPIALHDRIALMALRPIAPKRSPDALQQPCDLGLFDEFERNQIDLVEFLNSTQ